MKNTDLIIFDLDGTLVDSRQDIINAVKVTLKRLRAPVRSSKEIQSFIGTGVEDLLGKSLGDLKDSYLSRALRIFEEHFRRHYADASVLYPGVKELLTHFTDKKKSIVTNRRRQSALLTLRALGIGHLFEYVIGGDDLMCSKPDSCPLDKVIEESTASRDRTLMVGDMDIDILAGKAAGIATCAVTYGIGEKSVILKARPDFVIGSISELKKIIC